MFSVVVLALVFAHAHAHVCADDAELGVELERFDKPCPAIGNCYVKPIAGRATQFDCMRGAEGWLCVADSGERVVWARVADALSNEGKACTVSNDADTCLCPMDVRNATGGDVWWPRKGTDDTPCTEQVQCRYDEETGDEVCPAWSSGFPRGQQQLDGTYPLVTGVVRAPSGAQKLLYAVVESKDKMGYMDCRTLCLERVPDVFELHLQSCINQCLDRQ